MKKPSLFGPWRPWKRLPKPDGPYQVMRRAADEAQFWIGCNVVFGIGGGFALLAAVVGFIIWKPQ